MPMTCFKAYISRILKNIAFNNSKHYCIYFNISNNTFNIKGFIFFNILLKYHFFIIF